MIVVKKQEQEIARGPWYFVLLLVGVVWPGFIIVVARNEANAACVGESWVSYSIWLTIHGASLLIYTAFIFVFIPMTMYNGARSARLVIRILSILQFLFQVSWLVLGAILYFEVVQPLCENSSPIYIYGIIVFVMQCVIVAAWIIRNACR